MSDKTVVIGGGISGLTCAYGLMKAGCDVILVEKNERGGGVIRTGRSEGYLFEYGPNSTMNSNDDIDSLCRELGIDEERVFGNEFSKKRYVIRNGVAMPLPSGPGKLLSSKLWSTGGKLRLLKEPFVGRYGGDAPESVAAFVERRIGRELLEYALDPFVSGVYAGDPAALELKSTFPKMDDLESEYGSLIIGAIKKAFKGGEKSSRKKGIFSFKGGMEVLPKALEAALGERFMGGRGVTSIDRKNGGYIVRLSGGEEIDAGRVVLSAPAYAGADMVSSLSPELASELAAIEYAPIAVVFAGFDRTNVDHPLDGFGCLIPKREGFRLLGSLWSSTLFPGRAPEGKLALTCFAGGARDRAMSAESDESVLEFVMKDLKTILGVKAAPEFTNIVRYSRSIPQYNLGHGARLARMERALGKLPGLYLLGNYVQGVSVADCVKNGSSMAKRLLAEK